MTGCKDNNHNKPKPKPTVSPVVQPTPVPKPPVVTPIPVAPKPSAISLTPAEYANKKPTVDIDFSKGLPNGWITAIADHYGVWRKTVPSPYSASDSGKFNAEYYDPANLSYDSNGLTITTKRSDKFPGYTWSSGIVGTHGGYRFTGGYITFKAKMPDARYGMWGGMWFLEGGGEIDLHEAGFTSGFDPNRTMAINYHGGGQQKFIDVGVDMSKDFHDYGLEYIPGKSLKFYFDGKLVHTYTNNIPTGGYCILLNSQVAQNTQGWHTVVGPNTAAVNYMIFKSMKAYPL